MEIKLEYEEPAWWSSFLGQEVGPNLQRWLKCRKLQRQSVKLLEERMLPRFKPKPLVLIMAFTQKLNPNTVFGEVWWLWEIMHFLQNNTHVIISMCILFSQHQVLSLPADTFPKLKNRWLFHSILQNSHIRILPSIDGNLHLFGWHMMSGIVWWSEIFLIYTLLCIFSLTYIYPFICLLYVSFNHNIRSVNPGILFHL